MGRKVGLTRDDIVRAAATVADRDGLEGATLTAVAIELGIKTPSLYNHVDGLSGLRRLLAMHGAQILLRCFQEVIEGLEGADALRAVARANRRFAVEHPGLYASFLPAPRPGEDDELYQKMAEPVYHIAGILEEMGVAGAQAIHLIRALRSLLHGFVDLEANDGFGLPIDVAASFDESVELIIGGIEEIARKGERQP